MKLAADLFNPNTAISVKTACRPWLHAELRQLARMVAHRHDGGAGDCRPFPVLRLRLKRGAFEHHLAQPMRTWITSDSGCSTACGI